MAAGRATLSYQFKFDTKFKNQKTILQSYLDVIQDVDDAAQNLTQFYTVTKVNHQTGSRDVLGKGVVPPNNQGNATPFYNRDDKERTQPRMAWRPRPSSIKYQAVHRDAGRRLCGVRRPAR